MADIGPFLAQFFKSGAGRVPVHTSLWIFQVVELSYVTAGQQAPGRASNVRGGNQRALGKLPLQGQVPDVLGGRMQSRIKR